MTNQILTLRRKVNQTREICIDFSLCYESTLTPSNGAKGTVHPQSNGSGVSGETSHTISLCYKEEPDNKLRLTISEDGKQLDAIVIEDSDVDFIVIEDSDVDRIVIEDSDVDRIVEDSNVNSIKIKIPNSKDTSNMSNRLVRSKVTDC